jgi:hypothetical protein
MALGRLTPIQERVLAVLAAIEPRWTLTGGGALAGFHTGHRGTRDLDLFFRGQGFLEDLPARVTECLVANGLSVAALRTSPRFCQLDVRDDLAAVVVDLVADPTPLAEAPAPSTIGTTEILVDTPHQLLVNKLCALLSRSELRDLVDVRELVTRGGDISRALVDCPRQDAGFSPLTFGWALRGLPLTRLATSEGFDDAQIEELVQFRDTLIERAVAEARPAD